MCVFLLYSGDKQTEHEVGKLVPKICSKSLPDFKIFCLLFRAWIHLLLKIIDIIISCYDVSLN